MWWQAPPEPTWPAREQRLDWLEHALSEAYDISRGLAQHGALDGHASLSAYLSIVAVRARPPAAPCLLPNSCRVPAAGLPSREARPVAPGHERYMTRA